MTFDALLETSRVLPETVAAVALGLLALTLLTGFLLRHFAQYLASLRSQILVISLVSLGTGALVTVALSWLMIVDGDTLEKVVSVISLMVPLVVVLVLMATGPMGRDVLKVERALNRFESGDHGVQLGIRRSDEIGRVSSALESLGHQLEMVERLRASTDAERHRLDAERRYLLSSVSHDLRTPLAAMQAAVEALRDGMAPDPQRYLHSMSRDIDALTTLVDDLFYLAQVDAGRTEVEHEVLDLSELVDEAAEALQPVADHRSVQIVPRTPAAAPVVGSAAALGRMIRNLLDNAIRYSPDGAEVSLLVQAGDQAVTVHVLDQGPGFPPEFVERAFEQFSRAEESRNRSHGGSGLGLAIAKSIVAAHDGRISISPGRGGQVSVVLPRWVGSAPSQNATQPAQDPVSLPMT